jgi:hypothetical protein
MQKHSHYAKSIVVALTALCFVWVLSGHVVSVPAFAEGSGVPCPGEELPADTTISPGDTVTPNGGPTTTEVIEMLILFFGAAL